MKHEWKIGTWTVAAALLLVFLTGAVSTEDDQSSERPSLLAMSEDQARKLPLLHQEMRRILIQEQDRLADLYVEFEEESDSRRALEIQRKIHRTKVESQVALLQAQADAAVLEGRSEDAERLEQGIRLLKEPDKDRGPVPIPARAHPAAKDD